MRKIVSLDLSYCDFFDSYQVLKIMEVLNKIDTLTNVKFIQHSNPGNNLNEAEGYLKVISKMMKKNLSIQKLTLFNNVLEQQKK